MCLDLFGQARIPISSPINRMLGKWKYSWEHDQRMFYMCKSNENVLISKNFSFSMPPLLNSSSDFEIPKLTYITPSFSYTIYIDEFDIFLSRFFRYDPSLKVSLIFCVENKIIFLYDNSGPFYSYLFSGNLADVSDNFEIVEPTSTKLNFSIKLRDPVTDRITNTKLSYYRENFKLDLVAESKFYREALFYDSLKPKNGAVKTFQDLENAYSNLKEGAPDFHIKQTIGKLSELSDIFNGEWVCKFADLSLKMNGIKQFGTILIQLSDRIKISEEIFDRTTVTNFMLTKHSDLKKEIMTYAKFKYPYQTLSYNPIKKSVILCRGYDYVYKKGSDYFYQNEGAVYSLQNFSEREFCFKGSKFETTEKGRIIRKDLYIKWCISANGDNIVEYIKLGDSIWRKSCNYTKLK